MPGAGVEIRVLGALDQDRLEDFLRPRADSSIFLLSNSRRAGLVDRGERFEGTYFAAFEGDRIAGVIAHYWIGNLILQAPAHLDALMAAVLSASVRLVTGVLGPGAQVAAAERILGIAEERVQLDEREGLYALDLAELALPEALRSGQVRGRRIERRDLETVVAHRVEYMCEALGTEESPDLRDQCREDIESSLARGETWVLEDLALEEPAQAAGGIVASTSFNAALPEVVQVGGVWTPPALRGRGYGRAVVAASLLDARAEGVGRSILFTGDDNLPAVKAYAALGYRLIGDHRVLLFKPPA